MIVLSDAYQQHIRTHFGDVGRRWLQQLPVLAAELAARWHVTLLPPFPLSYNYVAPVVCADGTEAVLKLGVPDPEVATELAATELYSERGMVRLLHIDYAQRAMLLERVRPGTSLAPLAAHDDAQATRIAAQVMHQLFRPAPPAYPFPSLDQWLRPIGTLRDRFAGGTGPLPSYAVEQAETYRDALLASQGPPVVLHADLHHANILQASPTRWVAIDPKGVVGEAEYEVGTLLHNPWGDLLAWSAPRQILARRVAVLAEQLGFDRQRIVQWGVVNAMLTACWGTEHPGDGWRFPLACAEVLATLHEYRG